MKECCKQPSSRHGMFVHCSHKLTAAVMTYTRSSQQDQSSFQQAGLIRLSGLLAKPGDGTKGVESVLGVPGGSFGGGLRVHMIKIHSLYKGVQD